MTGHPTLTERADKASENTLLKLASRVMMTVGVPLALGVVGWYLTQVNTAIATLQDAQSRMVTSSQFNEAIVELTKLNAAIDKRTTTLETTTTLGRADRIDFQKDQTTASAKILDQLSLVLQGQASQSSQLSAIDQRLDANDKRIDGLESRFNNLSKGQ